jgi:hypothetical protein
MSAVAMTASAATTMAAPIAAVHRAVKGRRRRPGMAAV